MDSIGSIVASELKINNKIESHPSQPNVLTIHPTLDGYNSHNDNIICIIDLSKQEFQIKNQSELNSYWWLSFKSYCNQCQLIFLKYINSNCLNNTNNKSDKQEIDTDENKTNIEFQQVFNIIFDFISGDETELNSNDNITELFIENHFPTDSLISFNTPKPKEKFDFNFSYSDDNPYANMQKLQINDTNNDNKDDENMDYTIQLIRADINNNNLYKWFTYNCPLITSPKTTSRESKDAIYNDMLLHWECRLSQDNRFLLIFPEKLGEICDVYLTKKGKIYWIQSLFNGNKDSYLRKIFSINSCDVTQQFKSKVLKLLISCEEPSRFKILPCINAGKNNNILIWNFSMNGACNDLFTIISNDNENNKFNNKLFSINNAQSFHNYRFNHGDLKDLIRDVPKLCSLNGEIVFSGACFLSILNDVNKIHIYDAENDEKRLISGEISDVFCYDTYMPVSICDAKDNSKWITDYIPFKNNMILGRWNGNIGKSIYGIWKYKQDINKWKCIHSKEYDDIKWNKSIIGCYHFGDRIKTILLSISLQGKY